MSFGSRDLESEANTTILTRHQDHDLTVFADLQGRVHDYIAGAKADSTLHDCIAGAKADRTPRACRADLPTAIECMTGLTDRHIARQTLERRGRIAHERRALVVYLVAERKAHLAFSPVADQELGLDTYLPRCFVQFGPARGQEARLLRARRRHPRRLAFIRVPNRVHWRPLRPPSPCV